MSTINEERVDENEIMVSFDVNFLFTNVPIEGAVLKYYATETMK